MTELTLPIERLNGSTNIAAHVQSSPSRPGGGSKGCDAHRNGFVLRPNLGNRYGFRKLESANPGASVLVDVRLQGKQRSDALLSIAVGT